ncbi:MAG: hypothetical protein R3E62_03455 [Pseudomonadales bacterium]
MADNHVFDQAGTRHTESSHLHGHSEKRHADSSGQTMPDSNLELDGHHCHSSAHLFVSPFFLDISVPAIAADLPGYSSSHRPLYLSPGLRPPIA